MSLSAIDIFAAKTEVPSWARTAEWEAVPAALRRRAFFSAAVNDARSLAAERKAVADLLQGASKDGKLFRRDTAITELRRLLQERGLDTGAGNVLTNPAAEKRLKLVIDVNRAQAQGFARFKRAATGGALLAFPAQELVRVRDSAEKRDWRARWSAAGGKLYGGRMIALKDSGVWAAISRFGNPYPPFDFNSGMGVRDISRREALALGVIAQDWQPETDPVEDFNARAEADVADVGPSLLDALAKLLGEAAVRRGVARILS